MSSKDKITSNDFLDLLNDSEPENEDSPAFWKPKNHDKELNSTVSQPLANRNLTVSQPLANRNLTVSQPLVEKSGKKRKKDQPLAQALADPSPNRNLTVSQPLVEKLSGKRKKFIFWLFKIRHSTGNEITDIIDNETLFSFLKNCSNGSLRNLLSKLKSEGFIDIFPVSRGRVGLRKFKLNDAIYKEILVLPEEIKNLTVSQPSPNRNLTVSQPLAQALVGPSSSSSSNLLIKKNTTTTQKNNYVSQWKEFLDLSSLSNFGITVSTITRCLELYPSLEPEKIDDLIYRFEEYLKKPEGQAIKNPRGFFIALTKQLSEGVTPLDDIETPSEKYLREYVRKQEEKEVQKKELEEKALEFEFESWLKNLGAEEKDQLIPHNNLVSSGSHSHRIMLKKYFEDEVWLARREQIMRGDYE